MQDSCLAGSEKNQSALVRFEQLELEIRNVQQAVASNFGRWQAFLKGSICKAVRDVDIVEVRQLSISTSAKSHNLH